MIKQFNFADGWPIVMWALHEAVFGKYGERVGDETFREKDYKDVLARYGLSEVYMLRSGPVILYTNRTAIKIDMYTPQVVFHCDCVVDGAVRTIERFTNSRLVEVAHG